MTGDFLFTNTDLRREPNCHDANAVIRFLCFIPERV